MLFRKQPLLNATLFIILITNVMSCNEPSYNILIQESINLYELKKYKKAASTYSRAFSQNNSEIKLNDRYNAARCWTLAGYPDSSFLQLRILADKYSYRDYNQIVNDTAFYSLHSKLEWKKIVDLVRKNTINTDKNYYLALNEKLSNIYDEDQKYRELAQSTYIKLGSESPQMAALWKTIDKIDSVNILEITSILNKHGWLGSEIVGTKGNSALFLVIQHSNVKTQEKYLPMLRNAVMINDALPRDLAFLEDRISLAKGKGQIYGSQLGRDEKSNKFYLLPLQDPDNIDKRRAKIGLEPLSEYLKKWDVEWDLRSYKMSVN